jgi:YesN/AraC family two-component response regulator
MESSRCTAIVKNELGNLGLRFKTVELGQIELEEAQLSAEKWRLIDTALRNAGLELMIDKKTQVVEKIKAVIHQLIYFSDDLPKTNFSEYISKHVNHDYNNLSILFSNVEGVTIEKYVIEQKVQRAKELLVYTKLSLSEIAFKLKYSSTAHLSNQFKKISGLTPAFFRHQPVRLQNM